MATLDMIKADTTKEMESITMAVCHPKKAVTKPPAAAPKASIIDQEAPDKPFARVSSSLEQISGNAACLAGCQKLHNDSCSKASRKMRYTCSASLTRRKPSTTTALPTSQHMRMVLRLNRSATTPATGPITHVERVQFVGI